MQLAQRTRCHVPEGCSIFGGPCPSCICDHCGGTGAQDIGEPEYGQVLVDCEYCKGTGKALVEGK